MKGKSFADSIIPAVAVIFCLALTSNAQLTHQQKLSDFRSLVGLYNKQYAPYEWKVQAFDFDLLQLQPWLEQVNSSHDDLEFYDICVRYVASLQDSHDEFIVPSRYEVYLPITMDAFLSILSIGPRWIRKPTHFRLAMNWSRLTAKM